MSLDRFEVDGHFSAFHPVAVFRQSTRHLRQPGTDDLRTGADVPQLFLDQLPHPAPVHPTCRITDVQPNRPGCRSRGVGLDKRLRELPHHLPPGVGRGHGTHIPATGDRVSEDVTERTRFSHIFFVHQFCKFAHVLRSVSCCFCVVFLSRFSTLRTRSDFSLWHLSTSISRCSM